jgi:homogentisate 1,2-dioxygenase
MTYTEKFTWAGKELTLQREHSPVEQITTESAKVKLEKINVNDSALKPANYDQANGPVMPIFQADGVRVDLSKRSKHDMTFWHRNMECDELIFCYKGGIRWETELGNIELKSGEMFVIPKGIAHRSRLPEDNSGDNIIIELKIRGDVSKLI